MATPTLAPLRPTPSARASAAMTPPAPPSAMPAASEPPPTLPSPVPTPEPTALPTPATPAPSPALSKGALLVSAQPWAWVHVDGRYIDQTPFRALPLDAGPHEVELRYPGFRPFKRKVTIRAGETFTLRLDWTSEGVRE
jgi:hypothetical protein